MRPDETAPPRSEPIVERGTEPVQRPGGVLPVGRSAPPIWLVPPPERWKPTPDAARWIVPVLGLWLLVSLFAWPHTQATTINTGLVGVLLAGIGAVAIYVRRLRWLTAVLGAWLCLSTLVVGHVVAVSKWHDLVVGLVVVAASLVPSKHRAQRST